MLLWGARGMGKSSLVKAAQAEINAARAPGAVQVTLLVPTFLSERLDAARAAARVFLARYAGRPLYAKMFRRSGFDAEADAMAAALAFDDVEDAQSVDLQRMLRPDWLQDPAVIGYDEVIPVDGTHANEIAPKALEVLARAEEPFFASVGFFETGTSGKMRIQSRP